MTTLLVVDLGGEMVSALTAYAWQDFPMDLDEWDELPEDKNLELVDGVPHVVPAAAPRHQVAQRRLTNWIADQLPESLFAFHDVDVTLDATGRPTVRKPDVVIVSIEAAERNPSRFAAADVLVAVEIVSPGSARIDRVEKPTQYAKAGIPHYWLVELDEPITFSAYALVDGMYEYIEGGTGNVEITQPVEVSLDLDKLTKLR